MRLGELDFNREPDCLRDEPTTCADPHQDVPIARTTPHPGYQVRDEQERPLIMLIFPVTFPVTWRLMGERERRGLLVGQSAVC